MVLATAPLLAENTNAPKLVIGKIVPGQDIEKPRFPKHWGKPPEIQTRDMVKLPGKFGMGSSTLASWIRENLKKDAKEEKPDTGKPKPKPKPPVKPVPPIVPVPPAEVKEKLDAYKSSQKELQSKLLLQIKDLGEKPSKEAVRKVVEQFRKDNKSAIDAQKELGQSIHEWQKENRPERVKRPEPTPEIKEKIYDLREKQAALDVVKKEFHEKPRY